MNLASLGLRSREQRAWVMYDWANSAFATTVMATVLPIYFHDVAAAGLAENLRTAFWGYTSGAAIAVTALMAPILGAAADSFGATKRFLLTFAAIGAVATCLLWFVGPGEWRLASLLFLLGDVAFTASLVFYDALLPVVATADEADRVSTAGYAIGYAGGGVLLAANFLWIAKPQIVGLADANMGARLAFLSAGIWWLLFSFPLLRRVPEPARPRGDGVRRNPMRVGLARLAATYRQARRYRQVMLFLGAYWLYSDGIGTFIKMASIYGREIGIGPSHLIGALLVVQFVGIPASFGFGQMSEKLGGKTSIQLGLLVYAGVCVLGYFMTVPWHFWALAILVGLVQGGTQGLSRSLYSKIIPKSQAAEFFAFTGVTEKFAGILGPLLFGVIAQLTGGSRLSLLFLLLFFVAGMLLLAAVDLDEGQRVASEAESEIRGGLRLETGFAPSFEQTHKNAST